jgi:hypothetical protein
VRVYRFVMQHPSSQSDVNPMGDAGLGSIGEQVVDCVNVCINKTANDDPRWQACFKSALYQKTAACMQEKCTAQMTKCLSSRCNLEV